MEGVQDMQAMKQCLNWRVVAALVVVGLGVWLVAPNLIGATLPLLVLAACPLSMLVMMAAMGGTKGSQCAAEPAHERTPLARRADEGQLAELKARLVRVQAEQEALAGTIARLEDSVALARRATEAGATPARLEGRR